MLSGVILAAGEGSRMGAIPKALLRIQDKTFLEIISENLFLSVRGKVFIVLGYYSELIKKELKFEKEIILINSEPERGQLSSLQTAIRHMPEEVTAIMVTLADLPLIKLSTYMKLIESWSLNSDMIHVPMADNKRGHPVIFPKRFFKDLLLAPQEKGARSVVRNNPDSLIQVEVQDKGIFRDFDTIEDYYEIR